MRERWRRERAREREGRRERNNSITQQYKHCTTYLDDIMGHVSLKRKLVHTGTHSVAYHSNHIITENLHMNR